MLNLRTLTLVAFYILIWSAAQAQNVGIGTAVPASKLTVDGNLSVGDSYKNIAAPVDGAIVMGRVGIGTSQPDSNAILDISSSTKGLLLPRLTRAQRLAINSPTNGMIVYDADTATIYLYRNNSWNSMPLAVAPNSISSTTSWLMTGNSGTSSGTNFIGTTDNQALVFKVNNVQAGKIDQTLNNAIYGYQSGLNITTATNCTFVGYQSGYSNTSGPSNTGIGSIALNANTTGSNNTALGMGALCNNTTGAGNTSVGSNAMRFNTTASNNVAIGNSALAFATTANTNTAVGAYSMQSTTTGGNNTAEGYSSLATNTTGTGNTATGAGSMQMSTTGINNTANGNGALQLNTTGNNNAASGAFAMQNNTSGIYNSAFGYTALSANTTGGYNVAVGNNAGNTNTTGTNNTFIGSNADASSAALTNATAIGYNAKVAASNAIVFGGTGSYAVSVGVGTTSPGNTMEINSGTGGASGLRLKQLPVGAVLFMSASADVAQSNNNLYFDATNYRLGITAGTSPNSSLTVNGSVAFGVTTKTANYTASGSDYTILCNNITGAINITLPMASGVSGRIYIIKKISAAGNNVSILRNGSGTDLIDGATSLAISTQYNSYMLQSDGTNWNILAKY